MVKNLFTISGLTVILACAPLIYIVSKKLQNNKKLLPFLMYLICIFLWGIGSFLISLANDYTQAKYLLKYSYTVVIFISVFLYHALISINDLKRTKFLILIYSLGFIFAFLTLNDFLPGSPGLIFGSMYYVQSNLVFNIHFFIWATTILIAYAEIFILFKKSINTRQNFILLLASPIAFVGGLLNYAHAYNIPIYPFGNFFVALESIIYTYAILRNQFLDINIVIKKGIVYSLLISFVTIVYLIAVLVSEYFLKNLVGYQSLAMTSLLTFGIGLLFIPLKNAIENLIDRYFFKGSPEELSEQIQKYSRQVQEGEKYKTTATLASGLAHEIKNPLTAIRTFCEYLPERMNDKQFLGKFSKIVRSEAQRINDLVNDLAEYGKPSAPKISAVRIHRLLDETLELLSSACLQNKIKTEKLFDKDNALVLMADKNQIRQAALNILLNAIDAMPNGGTLTVATRVIARNVVTKQSPRDRHAAKDAARDDTVIEIIISDTGCGIPANILPKIFEPFFSQKSNGTGLGLPITKDIIEKHGGTISVKSEAGKGSEFVISLPVKKNEQSSKSSDSQEV